jgi:transcriptional regulator with XRE-family HTH domain
MKEYNVIDAFFENSLYKDEEQFVDKNIDITEQIYAYLEEKSWSQSDLAKALGKKSAEISKWLSGTHNLTLRSITKMETILGEDIIMTPQKAKEKYEKIKYVKISVHAKPNDSMNNKIVFTNSQPITVEGSESSENLNSGMAA